MEKLLDDVSSYEPFTREQILDEMQITGDDNLSIDECLELLDLAHTYGAVELKVKYSTLCSSKVDPNNSLRVLEKSIKSDDFHLAEKAFQTIVSNLECILESFRNNGDLKVLSKILASFIIWLIEYQ